MDDERPTTDEQGRPLLYVSGKLIGPWPEPQVEQKMELKPKPGRVTSNIRIRL